MGAAAIDWDNSATPQFQASLSLPHVQLSASQSMLAVVPAAAKTTIDTINRLRQGSRARLNAVLLLIPHPYPGGMSSRALRALEEDALALLPTYAIGIHIGKVTVSAYQNGLELLQVRPDSCFSLLFKHTTLTPLLPSLFSCDPAQRLAPGDDAGAPAAAGCSGANPG